MEKIKKQRSFYKTKLYESGQLLNGNTIALMKNFMNSYSWSRFTQRININAPIQTLHNAFATCGGMQSWFLRLSEYKREGDLLVDYEIIKEGDTYTWLWFGHPDIVTETGEILLANDKNELKFTFGKAGNVSVKIYEKNNENIVELTQDNIPVDEEGKTNWHLGCSTGWAFYLANLKSIMQGGIDLRNKNASLTGMLNA
ncbi:MAG: hypothetical protein ABJA35_02250 [Parafilimonas sp.]